MSDEIFQNNPFKPVPDTPLYQQIYDHLQVAILSKKLRKGLKLPSTRALADELHVSRNTVLNAYEQLMAEGYLETAEGSGTYVASVLPETLLHSSRQGIAPVPQSTNPSSTPPVLSQRAQAQLTSSQVTPLLPPHKDGHPRPFSLGLSALDAFPYKLWSRLVVRQTRRMSIRSLTYQDAAGYKPLRKAIAAHVTVSRRVHCTPDQIVIVAGTQGGLDLTARMLVDAGDPVWLEDPGYIGARGALLGVSAQIIPVPIDNEGLIVEAGMARAPLARLAYITPSHQFPLGVTMSLSRRLALLDWAKRANAYIIEDDYDSEYRFAGRHLPALQALDDAGRVIYIGSFSKVLSPALRIGYLILPPPLIEPFCQVRRLVDFHAPILEQAVLADFIAEGHFTRHLRRMRMLYAERRVALLAALRELPLEIHAAPVGSHCIGWLPAHIDEGALEEEALARQLNLWLISRYCIEPLNRQGLILGYGDHSLPEMQDAVRRLGAAMKALSY